MLRRELSGVGIGLGSYSMNRIETEHNRFSAYQQPYTDRDNLPTKEEDQRNNQILSFHKSKNKQLEERIDQLLRVNNQLNDRLRNINQSTSNVSSLQYYKEQVTKLEADNAQLQSKIKQLLAQQESLRDEMTGN